MTMFTIFSSKNNNKYIALCAIGDIFLSIAVGIYFAKSLEQFVWIFVILGILLIAPSLVFQFVKK